MRKIIWWQFIKIRLVYNNVMNMNDFSNSKVIEYVVMNPSQNITILVMIADDDCDYDYGFIAKKLLELEPTAEQVGFLRYDDESDIVLEMAGGEFCGNATMSAAVYYGILNGVSDGNVVVRSSGTDDPVNVHIKKINDWEGIVEMPKPIEICEGDFGNGVKYPMVFFNGIAHIIIDKKPIDKKEYENKIKEWCDILEIPALGGMMCDGGVLKFAPTNIEGDPTNVAFAPASGQMIYAPTEVGMTPLVYVKSIDSLYWESSCASGTTAIGAYLLDKYKQKINIDVRQPSGTVLNVESTDDGKLLLKGKVKFLYKKSILM